MEQEQALVTTEQTPAAPAAASLQGLSRNQVRYLAALLRTGDVSAARSECPGAEVGSCLAQRTLKKWRRSTVFREAERQAKGEAPELWAAAIARGMAARASPAVVQGTIERALMAPETDRDRTVQQRAAETVLKVAQVLEPAQAATEPATLGQLARRLWARRTTVTEELSVPLNGAGTETEPNGSL